MGSSSLDVRENKNEWIEEKVDCPGRKQRALITNDFYERNYNIEKKKKAVDLLHQIQNLNYVILFTWASRVVLGFNGPILVFPCSDAHFLVVLEILQLQPELKKANRMMTRLQLLYKLLQLEQY